MIGSGIAALRLRTRLERAFLHRLQDVVAIEFGAGANRAGDVADELRALANAGRPSLSKYFATDGTLGLSEDSVDDSLTPVPVGANRQFDRRRVMVLLGRTAVGTAGALGAAGLVETITGTSSAAGATTTSRTASCAGTFDSTVRHLYGHFAAQKFGAIGAAFDPAIILVVPDQGFPNPGTYHGRAAAVAYFQRLATNGWTATLLGVAGSQNYSLALHQGTAVGQSGCQSVLIFFFTAAGLVSQATFFGSAAT